MERSKAFLATFVSLIGAGIMGAGGCATGIFIKASADLLTKERITAAEEKFPLKLHSSNLPLAQKKLLAELYDSFSNTPQLPTNLDDQAKRTRFLEESTAYMEKICG